MVLVHDTSKCALQMYEVSLKYLPVIKLQSEHDFVTDRQIHWHTQGEKQYVSRPFQGRRHNDQMRILSELVFIPQMYYCMTFPGFPEYH